MSKIGEANMAKSSRFDGFFDLPGELRNKILAYVLYHPDGIVVGSLGCFVSLRPPEEGGLDTGSNPMLEASLSLMPLLLSNSKLGDEAEAVFFDRNVFFVNTGMLDPLPPTAHVMSWREQKDLAPSHAYSSDDDDYNNGRIYCALPPCENLMHSPSRFKIRRMVLTVHRLGGLLETETMKQLEDLILRGSLRWLEVCFGPFAPPKKVVRVSNRDRIFVRTINHATRIRSYWSKWKAMPEERLASNKGFLALLRLLNDPDLTAGRATVCQEDHWPVWCQFHRSGAHPDFNHETVAAAATGEPETAQAGEGSSRTPPLAPRTARLLELDVKAMLRKFGGEHARWWNI